jgi:hypothetical protein
MKVRGLITAWATVIFLMRSGAIAAQGRNDQGRNESEHNSHTQFDDHDRQVTRD